MRWRLFSRGGDSPRKASWRLFYRPTADVADLYALPGAVIEGRVASRYLMSGGSTEPVMAVTAVARPGVLVGPDVTVDEEAAAEKGIDVARMPRSGRAATLPAGAHSLDAMLLEESDVFEPAASSDQDTAVMLYTSGTIGKPKGVVLTHGNFVSEFEILDKVCPIFPEDRVAAVLPLFHVFGLTNALLDALYHGAAVALVPQYSPANLLSIMIASRATVLLATPSMIVHLIKYQTRRKAELPGTLRFCISGAAPLPRETIAEFQDMFGAPLMEGFGLTETTSAVSLNTRPMLKPGSVGRAPQGIEIRILGEDGIELQPRSHGEIAIRGPTVTRGYYNLPAETAEAFRDGWFLTGDIGYADEEGDIYITDRKKELIIKGGFNISPREIEDVLLANPAILEAAVVGVRREEREAIKAFVVARKGLTEADVLSHCQGSLASFKVPNMVEFRDVLPKSLTGKVLKKELMDGFRDTRIIGRSDGASGCV